MATLLYHWNFTGANDLNVNDEFYDSESNLKAVFRSRGTITSSLFSRGDAGITLDNNDSTNGGFYIDLEGLDNVELGGNLSIEMVIKNDDITRKAIYFTSIGEVENDGETVNAAAVTARFNDETKFLVRPDQVANVNYTNPPYRNVDEIPNNAPSGTTTVIDNDEHHYIFSLHYDSNGSSLKIYIDGEKKNENNANLEKALTTDARDTNFIGTRKNAKGGPTYLKGVIKYLKIYQNSMSDSQAESIYDSYNTSPYLSNVNNGTNGEKFTRRHDDVESYFTDNSSITSFSITGNQLGLSNGSENYKVLKFTHGDTFTISDNYNYIPIKGKDKFAILNYGTKYFRITQTSVVSNENAKYKCELSEGNADNFSEVCSNQGFGDTYTNGNITIIFGGAEFNVSNEICFHEDTLIKTDQGLVKIKDLKSNHTIGGIQIVYLVKSTTIPKKMVLIKKDAFDLDIPEKDTILTKNHLIFINKEVKPIHELIDNKNIVEIDNKNYVYNIILLGKNFIRVNNLFLNVFGIDEIFLNKLYSKKDDGEKNYTLFFQPESKIELDLKKLGNF